VKKISEISTSWIAIYELLNLQTPLFFGPAKAWPTGLHKLTFV